MGLFFFANFTHFLIEGGVNKMFDKMNNWINDHKEGVENAKSIAIGVLSLTAAVSIGMCVVSMTALHACDVLIAENHLEHIFYGTPIE